MAKILKQHILDLPEMQASSHWVRSVRDFLIRADMLPVFKKKAGTTTSGEILSIMELRKKHCEDIGLPLLGIDELILKLRNLQPDAIVKILGYKNFEATVHLLLDQDCKSLVGAVLIKEEDRARARGS
ncbi:MAG: hypothetical protein K0U74_13130 [Alphaproteobacteria bacterium]|nr:hypothetical protein [Alphaproteobacteria bacterium]